MAIICAAFFMSVFICTSSQYIYLNEKDECNNNKKKCETISTLVDELKNIQREVHQLRLETVAIRNLQQTNLTLYSRLQYEVDEIRMENWKLRELGTYITSTSKLHQEVHELRQGYKEIRNLLTNLNSTCIRINRDCKDLYAKGHKQSGVYKINPFDTERQIDVYCDMVTEHGGWTAIQKRVSGSISFDRTWAEYKNGFGNPNDSYWIGNDVIHQRTKGRNSSLYVSITLRNGRKLYELYNQFSVADEANKYRLFLGGPATGTLGDSMLDTSYTNNYDLSGMYFSTPDRDNDRAGTNCAAHKSMRGGWWYNDCRYANLNGPWSSAEWWGPWYPTVPDGSEIKETVMMIKSH